MTSIDIDRLPTNVEGLAPEYQRLHVAANALLGHLPVTATVFDHPDAVIRTVDFDMELPYQLNPFFPIDIAEAAQNRLRGWAYKAPEYSKHMFDQEVTDQVEAIAAADKANRYSGLVKRAGKTLMHRMFAQRWNAEAAEFNAAAEKGITVSQGFYVWERSARFPVADGSNETFEVEVAQTALDGTIRVKSTDYAFTQDHIATSLAAYRQGETTPKAFHVTTSAKRMSKLTLDRSNYRSEVRGTGPMPAKESGDDVVARIREARLPLNATQFTGVLLAVAEQQAD